MAKLWAWILSLFGSPVAPTPVPDPQPDPQPDLQPDPQPDPIPEPVVPVFEPLVSYEQFRAIIGASINRVPIAPEALYEALLATVDRYDINTTMRVRHYLAQIMAETVYLTKLAEDLYYSTPERLVAVWPSRFTLERSPGATKLYAPDYIRNPQHLANTVYSNRNGNGDYDSGDGYRYRGRGATHLTFLDNYRSASRRIYGDDRLVREPDLVAHDANAVMMTMGDYWDSRGLNELADQDAFTQITSRINGAQGKTLTRVVNERLPYLRRVRSVLG